MSDLLERQLRDLPAFRALLRAVEARFYDDLPMPSPVLDLGCGDGHFASVAFGSVEAGFDPWWGPLTEARQRSVYRTLALADGAQMPYPDEYFATVVSNSVLEHIPEVEPVIAEARRVLKPGGWFYFCVPGPNFIPFLSIGRALDGLGLRSLADAYQRFFNRISRHHHCDGTEVWEQRLRTAGLVLVRSWAYFSRRALTALEWGHYLGVPSLICKVVTGRWILWPSNANLWLTDRLMRPFYQERLSQPPAARRQTVAGVSTEGAYLFFVAQKPGTQATPV